MKVDLNKLVVQNSEGGLIEDLKFMYLFFCYECSIVFDELLLHSCSMVKYSARVVCLRYL